MIKLKSGNIIGKENIMSAIENAINNAKKKFYLIIKNIYPKFSKYSDVNIDVKIRSKEIVVSMKTSHTDTLYQQAKLEMRQLFLKILRDESRKVGLEVS